MSENRQKRASSLRDHQFMRKFGASTGIPDMDDDACWRALRTHDVRFDGRIFIGVRTTGIYCRPICPARVPKRENITFFASAAAAQEAGFRPCLRCRPEVSPNVAAWNGTSNTVTRALALIERGALDHTGGEDDSAGVEALAEKLGVGGRQLRRLFGKHLGATPVAVAQTRRVLLAKQLLHETRLPMAEVAMASGFGSVRRFNEKFRDLFGRPPAELRRATGAQGHEGITLRLPYRAPYQWQAMLAFLSARAIPGVEVVSAGSYARTVASGFFVVTPGKGDWLQARIQVAKTAQLPDIVARIRRIFDLAADPIGIGRNLAEDTAIAELVARNAGLRVPGAWDGFELAVRAILGQQITVSAATALAGKLVRAWGVPVTGAPGGLTHVFPEPARIAALEAREIASTLGMPLARGAAIQGLAAAVAADPGLFAPARNLEEAVTRLKELPGIGEWTAQYIAMREMREPDAFPHSDIGLLRAFATEAGERPTPAVLLKRAERWRPWRAYAALHLWRLEPEAERLPVTSKGTEQIHDRNAA